MGMPKSTAFKWPSRPFVHLVNLCTGPCLGQGSNFSLCCFDSQGTPSEASSEVRLQPPSDLAPQCFYCHLFRRETLGWSTHSLMTTMNIYCKPCTLDPNLAHLQSYKKVLHLLSPMIWVYFVQRTHGGSTCQHDSVERWSTGLGLWILDEWMLFSSLDPVA